MSRNSGAWALYRAVDTPKDDEAKKEGKSPAGEVLHGAGELTYDGENVLGQVGVKVENSGSTNPCEFSTIVDQKTFWETRLGTGTLGGISRLEYNQDNEASEPVATFAAGEDMAVHGDLEVKGDLCVDGNLVVQGEITTDFLHQKQEAPVPDEDEVFLTGLELIVIRMGLDKILYEAMSEELELSEQKAEDLLRGIYEKLIY